MSFANIRRILSPILISLLHGIFMLFLSICWLDIGFSIGLEEQLFKVSTLLKRPFINKEAAHKTGDSYCFIDISGNITTKDRNDGSGNDMVTDRKALSYFLETLGERPDQFKFLLCDVLLDEQGDGDSALAAQLSLLTNYVTPYYLENGSPRLPILNIPAENIAYSGYNVSHGLEASDKFLKYQLYANSQLKSVPQAMFEFMAPGRLEIENRYGLIWINDKPHFNTMIFDLLMRPAEPERGRDGIIVMPLNYAVNFLKTRKDAFFTEAFKDKIIVLGNFRTDIHETVYGKLAGPLILANIYEAVHQDKHRIRAGWVWWMILSFSVLSYCVFYLNAHRDLKQAMVRRPWVKKVFRTISVGAVIWFISLFSFFVFDVHADVIVMILYIALLKFIIRKWTTISNFLRMPPPVSAIQKIPVKPPKKILP